jgi:phage recombination protein Bet
MEAVAEYKTPTPLGTINITPEQVDLVKSVVFKGATDEELKLFFFECRRRGVHPLDRLIHPVVRKDKDGARRVSFQTSIDLFRSEAEGTGEYRGQKDVEYGPMTEWDKIDKKVPEYAKATIKRFDEHTGDIIEISATAYWEEYYPGEQLGFQWRKMPRLMLGKCAEALALRKAFPRKLAGLYTFEEMQLTDIISQGKGKNSTTEPKRKSEKKEPPPEGEKSVKEKLHEELSLYCQFEDGTVDMNMYASVLK